MGLSVASDGRRGVPRRHGVLALLVAMVTLLHGGAGWWLLEHRLGWGEADEPAPVRLDAAFVRELQLSSPPVRAAGRSRKARRVEPVQAPEPAASSAMAEDAPSVPAAAAAVEPAGAASDAMADADTAEPADEADEADEAAPAAEAALAADTAASQPEPARFEWPPSTRLSYHLTGRYRGPLDGYARVQWVRQGQRYQVQLDVTANHVFSRYMTSDGELTEHGLRPRRYDEETRVILADARRVTMRFEPDRIVMPDGSVRDTLHGVQDTASQLVQLTWLFTTQPERLRPGSTIELPLALPRRVDTWTYDVLEPETIETPFGPLETFHVRPRKPKSGHALTVETWFAPKLQYLPVRVRISQDADTFLDLVIDRRPQQAGP